MDFVEANGDQLRDARLFHRDTVEHVCDLHRPLVVTDQDELSVPAHLLDQAREPGANPASKGTRVVA